MTEIESLSMWDGPAEEITQRDHARMVTLAKAAVEPLWPYLSKAGSLAEFESRVEIARPNIESALVKAGVRASEGFLDPLALVKVDLRRRYEAASKECEHAGTHHSDDVQAIYHGRSEPTYLCGFHLQQVGDLSEFPRRHVEPPHHDLRGDTQPPEPMPFSSSKTAEDRKGHSKTCPRCGSAMSNVIISGDTLSATCDNCGWKGTKKKTSARDTSICAECGRQVSYDSSDRSWYHDNGDVEGHEAKPTKSATKTASGPIAWKGSTHFGVGYLEGRATNGDIYEVYFNPNFNPTPCSWVNYGPKGDTGPNSGIAEGRGFTSMIEAMRAAEAHAAGKTASKSASGEGYRCERCGMTADTDDFSVIGRNCSATDFNEPHKMVKTSSWKQAMGEPMSVTLGGSGDCVVRGCPNDVEYTVETPSSGPQPCCAAHIAQAAAEIEAYASKKTAVKVWQSDLARDGDSAREFAAENIGARFRIDFEGGDQEWGTFVDVAGEPEWVNERNDYSHPLEWDDIDRITQVAAPDPVGQDALFDKAPYNLTASRKTAFEGWPKVENPNFPGEQMPSCPKCGGGVIISGVPGYDGRMGGPGGGGAVIRCKDCGHSQWFKEGAKTAASGSGALYRAGGASYYAVHDSCAEELRSLGYSLTAFQPLVGPVNCDKCGEPIEGAKFASKTAANPNFRTPDHCLCPPPRGNDPRGDRRSRKHYEIRDDDRYVSGPFDRLDGGPGSANYAMMGYGETIGFGSTPEGPGLHVVEVTPETHREYDTVFERWIEPAPASVKVVGSRRTAAPYDEDVQWAANIPRVPTKEVRLPDGRTGIISQNTDGTFWWGIRGIGILDDADGWPGAPNMDGTRQKGYPTQDAAYEAMVARAPETFEARDSEGWLIRDSSRHTAETHAPYKIEERGGKYVVVNSIGETKGTHDTKEQAREQQKALYANVPGASEQAEKKSSAVAILLETEGFRTEAALDNEFRDPDDLSPACQEDRHNDCPDYEDTNCLCECHDHYGVPAKYRDDPSEDGYEEPPFPLGTYSSFQREALDVTCDGCGKSINRSEAYIRGGLVGNDWGQKAYCSDCAEEKGLVEASVPESAVAALLHEATFWTHNPTAESDTFSTEDRKRIKRVEPLVQRNRQPSPEEGAEQQPKSVAEDDRKRQQPRAAGRRTAGEFEGVPLASDGETLTCLNCYSPLKGNYDHVECVKCGTGYDPKSLVADYAHSDGPFRHKVLRFGVGDIAKVVDYHGASRRTASPETWTCPECEHENPVSDDRCEDCGAYAPAGYDDGGRTSTRRQAVNEDAYGTERYQSQPEMQHPDWIRDAWDDKGTESYTQQGMSGYQKEHPFAERLVTPSDTRTAAVREAAVRIAEGRQDIGRLPGRTAAEFHDDGDANPATNESVPTAAPGVEEQADTQARTTKPRGGPGGPGPEVSLSQPTEVAPGQMGGGGDFGSYADPLEPSIDQLVAAKVVRVAKRVQQDNPTMGWDEARRLAARTIAKHPEMVKAGR